MYVYIFIRFNLETYLILLPIGNQCIHFFFRQSQRVTHRHTGRSIVLEIRDFLTFGVQLRRSIESNIRLTAVKQHLYIFLINITTFRLTVGTVVTTKADSFVEVYPQPLKRLNDIFFRTRNKAI